MTMKGSNIIAIKDSNITAIKGSNIKAIKVVILQIVVRRLYDMNICIDSFCIIDT